MNAIHSSLSVSWSNVSAAYTQCRRWDDMKHQTSSHPRCGVSAGGVVGYACMEYQLYTLQIIQTRTCTNTQIHSPITCDYVHCVLYVYDARFGESQSVSDETRDGILPPQVSGEDKPADSSTPGPPTEPNDPLTL